MGFHNHKLRWGRLRERGSVARQVGILPRIFCTGVFVNVWSGLTDRPNLYLLYLLTRIVAGSQCLGNSVKRSERGG